MRSFADLLTATPRSFMHSGHLLLVAGLPHRTQHPASRRLQYRSLVVICKKVLSFRINADDPHSAEMLESHSDEFLSALDVAVLFDVDDDANHLESRSSRYRRYCSQHATPTGRGQTVLAKSHFVGSHSSMPLKLQAQSSPNSSAMIQATSCRVYVLTWHHLPSVVGRVFRLESVGCSWCI